MPTLGSRIACTAVFCLSLCWPTALACIQARGAEKTAHFVEQQHNYWWVQHRRNHHGRSPEITATRTEVAVSENGDGRMGQKIRWKENGDEIDTRGDAALLGNTGIGNADFPAWHNLLKPGPNLEFERISQDHPVSFESLTISSVHSAHSDIWFLNPLCWTAISWSALKTK